jgi:hypothetical protein
MIRTSYVSPRTTEVSAMQLAVAPALRISRLDRPSPPDTSGLMRAAQDAFPTNWGAYTVADQQSVYTAALRGGRTGAELASAATVVKAALPTNWGAYTTPQQLLVLNTALQSWYELDSLSSRLEGIKQAMPTNWGAYTSTQQVDAMVSTYQGRDPWTPSRPTPPGA